MHRFAGSVLGGVLAGVWWVAAQHTVLPAQTVTPDQDRAEMVLVPAGEFWMGSDDGADDEKPRRKVVLDAFSIDRFEVSNALYARFVAATHRASAGSSGSAPATSPVVEVSWDDAASYCAWARKRLPTEAEWEKAARGTDGRRYPWGDQWDGTRANSAETRAGGPVDVKSYPSGASPYGVHNMAGNVWEWVADWYDEGYYPRSVNRDPTGPASGKYRVLRGGSWDNNPGHLRAAERNFDRTDVKNGNFGFRCAKGRS